MLAPILSPKQNSDPSHIFLIGLNFDSGKPSVLNSTHLQEGVYKFTTSLDGQDGRIKRVIFPNQLKLIGKIGDFSSMLQERRILEDLHKDTEAAKVGVVKWQGGCSILTGDRVLGYISFFDDLGPDLRKFYLQNPNIKSPEIRHIAKQIMEFLKFMYKNNYVHGDINPTNFLYLKGRLTIVDFERAHKEGDANRLTPPSGWYRDFQIVLGEPGAAKSAYGPSNDMWGAILTVAELFKQSPIFGFDLPPLQQSEVYGVLLKDEHLDEIRDKKFVDEEQVFLPHNIAKPHFQSSKKQIFTGLLQENKILFRKQVYVMSFPPEEVISKVDVQKRYGYSDEEMVELQRCQRIGLGKPRDTAIPGDELERGLREFVEENISWKVRITPEAALQALLALEQPEAAAAANP